MTSRVALEPSNCERAGERWPSLPVIGALLGHTRVSTIGEPTFQCF